MKRRSHRLPIADTPHDDWVDESWTVDCVCGVNFDDGEEMVNCDECGVWVHTRCSRYVKGEKSFACHKCKRKNERDDNEETEVAQLLVELPTKTLRMDDNPYPSSVASRRPVRRLWTEIPIEERVHVQGVPGGDPSLFSGLSSVFSPQLWKCTGYVPKKLNFQYREFPSGDDEDKELLKRNDEENGNNADNKNTNGVLCSLREENKSPLPLASPAVAESPDENDKCEKVASLELVKRLEGEDTEVSLPQNTLNKGLRLPTMQQPMITSAKRKKEVAGSSEDQNFKKKARIIEVGGDSKKKSTLATTASTILSNRKQLQFNEDRGLKAAKANNHSRKTGDTRNSMPAGHLSNSPSFGVHNTGNNQKPAAANDHGLEAEILNLSRRNAISDGRTMEDDNKFQVGVKAEYSPRVNDVSVSGSLSVREEVIRDGGDSSNGNVGDCTRDIGLDLLKSEPIVEETVIACHEVKYNQNIPGSNGDIISSSSDPSAEGKAECDENHAVLDVQRVSATNSSGNVKVNDAAISSSESSDQKGHDMDRTEAVGGDKENVAHALTGGCQPMPEPTGSEGSLDSRKGAGHKHRSKALGEKPKVGDVTSSNPSQRKVVSVGKTSSLSSASVISKSCIAGSRSSSKSQMQYNNKQRGISDGNLGSRRESASCEVVWDEERSGRSKKNTKEAAKSSLSPTSRTSQSTKFSHTSVHRRSSSDDDSTLHSSSKTSKVSSATATPGSGKSASSLQTGGPSSSQIKVPSSGLLQKGEKSNLPGAQLSYKVNTPQMQPPASSTPPATLSDEELALLLHQQLNSSPRVPRVPRMRHAGSVPQLTSPTAASMLLKRTSSSGGKDHSSTNRRRTKDSTKDGSHGSRDANDETKKMDRVPPDTEG